MSDQTHDLADQAAEAIQSLCHLTRGEEALKHPGDICEVVAGLRTMAARLSQLFAQLASWLIIEGDRGRIEHDSGQPARPSVGQVIAGLSDASDAADEMAAALTEANGALAACGLRRRHRNGPHRSSQDSDLMLPDSPTTATAAGESQTERYRSWISQTDELLDLRRAVPAGR